MALPAFHPFGCSGDGCIEIIGSLGDERCHEMARPVTFLDLGYPLLEGRSFPVGCRGEIAEPEGVPDRRRLVMESCKFLRKASHLGFAYRTRMVRYKVNKPFRSTDGPKEVRPV